MSDIHAHSDSLAEHIRPAQARPFIPPVRVHRGWHFVSGQMALDADLKAVGETVAEQTMLCLDRIRQSLHPYGLSLADVVKTNVWLTRIEDFPEFNAAYASAFAGLIAPARSTVRADLMIPGALVEIEALACPEGP